MQYIVTGIVQACINDEWSEQIVRIPIIAPSSAAAWMAALDFYAADLPANALVRWHNPELVRVEVA